MAKDLTSPGSLALASLRKAVTLAAILVSHCFLNDCCSDWAEVESYVVLICISLWLRTLSISSCDLLAFAFLFFFFSVFKYLLLEGHALPSFSVFQITVQLLL
jgi:hypothetical protein